MLASRAMPKFMQRFERETYALMRIVVGFLFLWHGMQKLFGYPPGMPAGIPAFVIYVGGPIEFFGGLFVMLGLFTRWAAFLASGMMAVAYWLAHGWRAPLPFVNQGEPAVLYCFVFLHIGARGPGIWSVEGARGA
jgi:putative oxidoreductase